MIARGRTTTGGVDDAGGSLLGRDFGVELVDRPGATWDEMTAHFADAAYEQSVAYAASRWGARRLSGLVLRDARQRVIAATLAVTVELPLVKAGVAYVKFGPLWRARDHEVSLEVLAHALLALRQELGERRGLLVRVTPPADPGFESAWHSALREAGFTSRTAFPHPADTCSTSRSRPTSSWRASASAGGPSSGRQRPS